jgi:TonB family protein
MRQINLISIKWAMVLLMVLVLVSGVFAGPDIQVDLRLYEGAYGHRTAARARVETSYYLKPMFAGNVFLDVGLAEEVKEIKKIFNLRDVNLLTKARWGWKYGRIYKQSQVMSIDGREFLLQLAGLPERDHFRLTVKEKASQKEILETEIILPQQKTSIFGFENSEGKPYFISIQRSKDKKITGKEPVMLASIKKPKLIKKVDPGYPKEAVGKGIEGKVVLEAVTGIYGIVREVEVVEGDAVLNKAAVEALKQWVYEPYIINGAPKPVRFTVVMNFRLGDDKEKDKPEALSPQQLIENIKNKQFGGEPYDLNLKDAQLDNVIQFLSKSAGLKIVLDPGVKGRVTCEMEKVPWDKALAFILEQHHLTLVLEGDVLKIRQKK